jgi:hypothetical protein
LRSYETTLSFLYDVIEACELYPDAIIITPAPLRSRWQRVRRREVIFGAGRAYEREHQRKVEWRTLGAVIVLGSSFGSFLAIAAVWAAATHFGAVLTAIITAVLISLGSRTECCGASIYSYVAFKPRCSNCHNYQ